jgi:hypothetical protein
LYNTETTACHQNHARTHYLTIIAQMKLYKAVSYVYETTIDERETESI